MFRDIKEYQEKAFRSRHLEGMNQLSSMCSGRVRKELLSAAGKKEDQK